MNIASKDALNFFSIVPEIRQKEKIIYDRKLEKENVNVGLRRFLIIRLKRKNSEENVSPILPFFFFFF